MPPPPSPPFELFDEQPCSARLPVRTVTDEFDFVHFVTLVEFKTLAQWVVPLDVFNPVAAAHIRASFPDVPLIRLRGGASLNPDWNQVVEPHVERGKIPAGESVTVTSVNEFLA